MWGFGLAMTRRDGYLILMPNEARLDFPATGRNAAPILDVLHDILPDTGHVLEIASGSGQHAAHFAKVFSSLTWQPTDLDPTHRQSIAAWTKDLPNVRAPIELDATSNSWPVSDVDVIICANMIHIAPWTAGLGLLAGAGRTLGDNGMLYLYGPYMVDGVHTAESNAQFDISLKQRDPSWGVRDLGVVTEVATEHGLELETTIEMPANNLSVVFRKSC
jgi:SAM-dependent methyltransferase